MIKYCIQMCTAQIEARFGPNNIKLLELSGIQAIVLLSFNDLTGDKQMSLQELIDKTGLESSELRKTVISLSMVENQIIKSVEDQSPLKMQESETANVPAMMSKKKTIKKGISATDKFFINLAFKSKMRKIVINTIQKKENRVESDAVHEKVLQDRKHYIDAAVVKTMKGRKTLKHNDLIAEVMRLTRFPCEQDMIMQRIKHLIEAEYMEPD